jgi:hypothetical protein
MNQQSMKPQKVVRISDTMVIVVSSVDNPMVGISYVGDLREERRVYIYCPSSHALPCMSKKDPVLPYHLQAILKLDFNVVIPGRGQIVNHGSACGQKDVRIHEINCTFYYQILPLFTITEFC